MKSLLLVLAGTATASAAPPSETAPREDMVVHVEPQKSETTATLLTAAGIAVPIALTYLTYEPDTDAPMYAVIGGTTGLLLPSIGHWYSGRFGTYGLVMRLTGLMFTMVGLDYLDDADRCDRGEQVTDGCDPDNRAIGRVSLGLGIATWAGSWVYDVLSARREVRRYNERTTVRLTPLLARDATGVSISGAF